MSPKIIQLLIAPNDNTWQGRLLGLADDGGMYSPGASGKWEPELAPLDIPLAPAAPSGEALDWLDAPEHEWFRKGWAYASTQTRAIPGMQVGKHDAYFLVWSIMRGAGFPEPEGFAPPQPPVAQPTASASKADQLHPVLPDGFSVAGQLKHYPFGEIIRGCIWRPGDAEWSRETSWSGMGGVTDSFGEWWFATRIKVSQAPEPPPAVRYFTDRLGWHWSVSVDGTEGANKTPKGTVWSRCGLRLRDILNLIATGEQWTETTSTGEPLPQLPEGVPALTGEFAEFDCFGVGPLPHQAKNLSSDIAWTSRGVRCWHEGGFGDREVYYAIRRNTPLHALNFGAVPLETAP